MSGVRREAHLVPVGGGPGDKPLLEEAMRREPANADLRGRYRSVLESINRSTLGISTIVLPELPYPLYFRGGSSDLANFDQIFGLEELSVPLPHPPARILDLGAYAGYAAVYMAQLFPDGEILCVEPSPANFKLLTLNTSAYPHIRRLNAAVWRTSTTLAVDGHELGDWGTHFAASGEGGVPAWSVDDILAQVGWDRADFVKCDIEGAEREVFADPSARWHQEASCVTVETHDAWVPGCLAAVQRCFPEDRFDRVWSGEVWAFVRRGAPSSADGRPMMLFEPPLARLPITLTNVSDGIWGFMLFDERSCQLHPNDVGAAPATLSVEREFSGQRRFVATLSLPAQARSAVRFCVEVRSGERDDRAARGEWVVAPGQQRVGELKLPPLSGRHCVIMRTEMAEATGDSFHAWAHWLEPQFM